MSNNFISCQWRDERNYFFLSHCVKNMWTKIRLPTRSRLEIKLLSWSGDSSSDFKEEAERNWGDKYKVIANKSHVSYSCIGFISNRIFVGLTGLEVIVALQDRKRITFPPKIKEVKINFPRVIESLRFQRLQRSIHDSPSPPQNTSLLSVIVQFRVYPQAGFNQL